MSTPESLKETVEIGGRGAITLDDLIALNDEIVALVRAGVPLDRGLSAVGQDLGGRRGKITARLARHLEQGQSLPEALETEREHLPPIYRAVVAAGMGSGRLGSALEGLADFARGYAELRRAIGLALLYPIMILVLAYGLFVGFVVLVLPRIIAAFESLNLAIPGMIYGLQWLGDNATYWAPLGPVTLILLVAWWGWTGSSSLIGPKASAIGLVWVPWMGGVIKNARSAHFSDLLALLIDHEVPLHCALVLAADATGDKVLIKESLALSESLQLGTPLAESLGKAHALPGMLRWLMSVGHQQGSISRSLRLAAETYRRRALQQARFIKVFLPTILLIGIGATATLVYTMTLFVPMATLLGELSDS